MQKKSERERSKKEQNKKPVDHQLSIEIQRGRSGSSTNRHHGNFKQLQASNLALPFPQLGECKDLRILLLTNIYKSMYIYQKMKKEKKKE